MSYLAELLIGRGSRVRVQRAYLSKQNVDVTLTSSQRHVNVLFWKIRLQYSQKKKRHGSYYYIITDFYTSLGTYSVIVKKVLVGIFGSAKMIESWLQLDGLLRHLSGKYHKTETSPPPSPPGGHRCGMHTFGQIFFFYILFLYST